MQDGDWNPNIADRTGHAPPSMEPIEPTTESDLREEPPSFEAWVSDLSQAHVGSEAAHGAVGEAREYALKLHAMIDSRAKLARGMLLVATVMLPLVLLLYGVHASAAGHRLRTGSSSPYLLARARAVAPWLAAHLGANPAEGALDVQPANTDGDVVYACWVDAPSGQEESTPLHLVVSSDGAATWHTLSSPLPRATACHLVPDAADARHVGLAIQLDARAAAGCPPSRLFASRDSGLHWSAVALPAALTGACPVSLVSTGGTLVLWSNGAPAAAGISAGAQIWISLASGTTWHAAGTGLPSGLVESVVSARADGALLVLMRRPEAGGGAATQAAATSELWSCPAGCPRWQQVALVPGSAPRVFTTPSGWLSSGGGWGTLYAADTAPSATGSAQASSALTVSTPADAAPIYVSAGTQVNTWRPLPPPPWSAGEIGMPGESADAGHILGVGPDGTLLLESENAAVALEPGATTQVQAGVGVLSMWDPHYGQWLTPVLVEPAASTALAVVWDEQGVSGAPRLTIWLGTPAGDVWPVIVPNSDWPAAQAASRCQHCE